MKRNENKNNKWNDNNENERENNNNKWKANSIWESGAIAIGESLKTNTTLTTLYLSCDDKIEKEIKK